MCGGSSENLEPTVKVWMGEEKVTLVFLCYFTLMGIALDWEKIKKQVTLNSE
ncbi:hypothetical protein FC81_GL000770 [Liquorilactobacillus capillatus DSM 19910]|uniref:Uncharacterized protein n=1 Tax=Liquorilactobacillus capillatus DSM 19910 TaxID=1423731 RepID=A0A0R1MBY8_9LACO|nr:hypothetical protein FC81_GL000770 [Liquorilactobacillus capillatus DSM 19910]